MLRTLATVTVKVGATTERRAAERRAAALGRCCGNSRRQSDAEGSRGRAGAWSGSAALTIDRSVEATARRSSNEDGAHFSGSCSALRQIRGGASP